MFDFILVSYFAFLFDQVGLEGISSFQQRALIGQSGMIHLVAVICSPAPQTTDI